MIGVSVTDVLLYNGRIVRWPCFKFRTNMKSGYGVGKFWVNKARAHDNICYANTIFKLYFAIMLSYQSGSPTDLL